MPSPPIPAESPPAAADGIAEVVRRGLLAPSKALPPVLLYDDAGSALFEQITSLPEYYLTRTERDLLAQHAGAIAAASSAPDAGLTVVELGAGSADKTVVLLEAISRRTARCTFHPVDVSAEAHRLAIANVRARAPGVRVEPLQLTNDDALVEVARLSGGKLVLFIGSSIGNHADPEAVALLARVRGALGPGDALLLGADRIKSTGVLLAAYNDSAGVTAAFMKNALSRINRELGGRFDLDAFDYLAAWNEEESCVAMYLVSRVEQGVRIDALDQTVRFERGERVHMENSIKYDDARLAALVERAGFRMERSFVDERGYFGLHLCRVD